MWGKRPSIRVLFAVILLFAIQAGAQQGFYIPKNARVHFGGDTATIFSNVINNGKLGIDKNAVINFKGRVWENDAAAAIIDETDSTTGTGGWIRFWNETAPQQLRSGYNAAAQTGPVFPNLQIANPFGVHLFQNSAKVRHRFSFEKGLLYLNNQVFVVGNNNPGEITGYSNNRFFVTGTQPGGGLLVRENVQSSDGLVVFPVGPKAGSYAPAAMESRSSQGDDFFVSVFDGVRANLLTGADLGTDGVNKTWQAGKLRRPGRADIELYLQHQVDEEGRNFMRDRNKSYISQYLGASWDIGATQVAPIPGTLTTAQASFALNGLNSRSVSLHYAQYAYFTKLAVNDSLRTKIIWGAYRLTPATVVVNWQTKPEINVRYFVVQRRLSNETAFSNVVAHQSKARNGISLDYLNYSINDANSYGGISYYRLQVFDYTGQFYYTNIVAVSSDMGNKIVLWPNPTSDRFSVLVNSPEAIALVIYNALGQRLYVKPINASNQNVVEVSGHGLISGAYFVGILDRNGRILDNTKLIIQK